ncbi:MAG: transcription-repair coupling factor [Lachnospiraceae bacterium]|nr:transcription-repair coupling factor [Lachnospiraceae bacterium]
MNCVTAPLRELNEFEEISTFLARNTGAVFVSGCIDSQKVHFMKGLGEKFSNKLILTYSEIKAKEIYEDYKFFDDNVYYYPAKDLIFYNVDIHSNLIVKERFNALKAILENDSATLILSVDGCMDKLMPFEEIQKNIITLKEGDVIDVDEFKALLITIGYERMAQVEGSGQFAIRGGIIDIFPLTEENPIRIELWDEEIDTIRYFDIESQRSIDNVEEIKIYPAKEIILSDSELQSGMEAIKEELRVYEDKLRKSGKIEEAHRLKVSILAVLEEMSTLRDSVSLDSYIGYFGKKTTSLLDYFDREDTVIFIDEPTRVAERAEVVELEFRESMAHRLENGYVLPGQTDLMVDVRSTFANVSAYKSVLLAALEQKPKYFDVNKTFYLSAQNISPYNNSFETLVKDLGQWKKRGYRVLLLSGSRTRAQRLAEDLREFNLTAYYREGLDTNIQSGEIMVTKGNVHRGFEYPLIKFVVITETDIFGAEKKKKKKKSNYGGEKISNFADLSIGDYVIHEGHGLGIYKGIEQIVVDKVAKDYIKIEYGDGGNLYVLATQLDSIQKYSGANPEGRQPKLNKLGGQEWHKTKTKVKTAVKEIAKELVELYATRQAKEGYVYGEDTVWQREFEEMFPYEETADQLNAIEAAKKDMESTKIMDRLICGDVGYGKTEVAIRAAFKAVQDGKQVVYLVPTTILAQQHYNTFCQRMKDFPITVELLSRFRTPKEQQKAIDGLKKGFVDIVIGTHRVLSKDVVYKDLGLLIIDEEQRFGVTHKEKIKQMKANVDVLTLTATPIPRTLHMSLIGIRDMSVLEEPPMDRLPIQTFVLEHNDEVIREAVNRELARNGQVYYVYNRVNGIDEIADRISKLVPEAQVAYAHGQMSERQLEKIMFDFINGDIDVLVSTTIIETGLDISNVNTMIIHDADKLGLSQLYQLRGRVGRSNRTSYAFLMYKRDKLLKEVAEKRLQAIREFTDLGSGFKIAMRDLEIRGAGNILGAQQHGHMEAVGYDLYCKMLNEAVKTLKGESVAKDFETMVEMKINAYIPSSYIKNEMLKLDTYKRIAGIETEEEYSDMQDELIDRFGDMPESVNNLLLISYIKSQAHAADITEINANKGEIRLKMYEKANVDAAKIPELIADYGRKLKFVASATPYFLYTFDKKENVNNAKLVEVTRELVEKILGIQFRKED